MERKNMSYSMKEIKMIDRVCDVYFLIGVSTLLVLVSPLFLLIYVGIKVAEIYMQRKKHGKKCKR